MAEQTTERSKVETSLGFADRRDRVRDLPEKGSIESSPINIGTGIPTKISDLAGLVIDLSDTHQKPKFAHPRLGDIKHNFADTKKASRVLGFSPVMTLRNGLQELMDNYGKE